MLFRSVSQSRYTPLDFDEGFVDSGVIFSILSKLSDDNKIFEKEIIFDSFENFANYETQKRTSTNYTQELENIQLFHQYIESYTETIYFEN